VALLALAGTHSGRTAVRTLFFLPEMFPNPPVRPLLLISPAPICEEQTLLYADVQAIADLCAPPGPGPYGGLVLTLGVHPLPHDDPFLVRLSDGLARTNLAVLRVASPDLGAGRIVPREIDGLVAAFRALQAHRQVDPTRVGFAGFSVGGALATVAAADPRLRHDVRLVNSFGAYYDAFAVLRAITARRQSGGDSSEHWEPHPWTIHVFAEQIVAALPAGEEQDYLTALLSEDDPPPEAPSTLSPLGTMVQSLIAGEAVDGDALLAALPDETRAAFARLSPATTVANLEAPMYVMHDVGDHLVPYTESRQLVSNLPPGVLQRHAEFHMFEHVYPRDPTQVLGLLPELVELYGHLYAVFFELTD
jgi:acetyl esterase/lipase